MARMNVLRKSYVFADGTTRRSAKEGATALRLEILDGKEEDGKTLKVANTIDFDPTKVNDAIRFCAMLHGFSQKIGDEVAGAQAKAEKAGETFGPDFVTGLISDAIDNLLGGVWVEEGEGSSGGSNITILFEAVLVAFAEAGSEIPDTSYSALRAKLADKAERDKFRASPEVASHVARITAERAAKRAAEAAAKAKAAQGQEGAVSLASLFSTEVVETEAETETEE